MILLTTSDYFPNLGGLSTFTKNIEEVLLELGLSYDVFHWKSHDDIAKFSNEKLDKYKIILNVHVMFAWFATSNHDKMINFVHGSEILMTSPNILKRLIKKIFKNKYFNKMYSSQFNLFISKATELKARERGFSIDYSRDLIFHNCIDQNNSKYIELSQEKSEEVNFICIARNVPHKNIFGTIKFCEEVCQTLKKPVKLVLPNGTNFSSNIIKIEVLSSNDDSVRNLAFTNSHYNLLLSFDHSQAGFYEGFGLTVLEAGQFGVPSIVFNTGGLPEAVHDEFTGYVLEANNKTFNISKIKSLNNEQVYQELRVNCFKHTVRSHSLSQYKNLIQKLVSMKEVA